MPSPYGPWGLLKKGPFDFCCQAHPGILVLKTARDCWRLVAFLAYLLLPFKSYLLHLICCQKISSKTFECMS